MITVILVTTYLIIGVICAHAEHNKDNKLKAICTCLFWPIIGYVYIGMLVALFVTDLPDMASSNPLLTVFVVTVWPLFVIFLLLLFLGKKLINLFKK